MNISLTKYIAVVLICLSCALPGNSAVAGPSADHDADRDSLLAADEAWSQSVNDTEAFLSRFTDDASFMPAGAPLARGDAIRATWEALVSNPGFSLEWTATGAEVARSGDLGYTIGSFRLVLEVDGTPMAMIGKFSTVWKRHEDGSWKVQVDCFNADGPPTPADSP
ncbi:MAG: DUF4440 domain-containing protein [Xanthomonadales bacterium]|nr:DUF4440 domain-containing protein [Xanthomonadales bacterium]NIX13219.1 DUF4440 domain-containing protein [Xanthomonadales bacterium]